jgi:hypothetical protein
MKRILFNRITFFVLFALIAVILMGATVSKPVSSDLHQTAKVMASESAGDFRSASKIIALQQPGAVLRANVIK